MLQVKNFIPILGDYTTFLKSENKNKFGFYHYIEMATRGDGIDFRLIQIDYVATFDVCSIKTMNQFEKLIIS